MSAAPPLVLAGINVVRRPGQEAYAGLAAALLASAVALIVVWNAAWWQTVALALGPDLAVLYGIAPCLARGQLVADAPTGRHRAHLTEEPVSM
jgi:hypothetical protein